MSNKQSSNSFSNPAITKTIAIKMSKIVRPKFVSATIASKIAKAPSMIWAALTHFGDFFIVTVITDLYLVELYISNN